MTRQEFKESVFAATKGKCCVPNCTCDAVDAHHIMNRHLWANGGYILSNGAALCEKHHLEAERGVITPRQCMEYMGVEKCDIKKPDAFNDILTDDEYMYLLMNDEINSFGELI
jgi:hypothetical protein